MESIVFGNNIPDYTIEDCVTTSCEVHPLETVVEPGFLIRQSGGLVQSRYPDNTPHFAIECDTLLHKWHIHNRRCIGFDNHCTMYIFSMNSSQPRTLRLVHNPTGACFVPKTNEMLHWTLLALHVTNVNTGETQTLRGHVSRIISADASSNVAVTGDYTGHVRIWYTASWKCHHDIKSHQEPCQQIKMKNDDQMAVRHNTNVIIYDNISGKSMATIDVNAISIEWTSFGLVIATKKNVFLYKEGKRMMSFECNVNSLYKSMHDKVLLLSNRKLYELQINDSIVRWPNECNKWIQNPMFPVPHAKWPKRYLNVLAEKASDWVPHATPWHLPSMWIRCKVLREAIWDAVLEHERWSVIDSWDTLPTHQLSIWYQKCEAYIRNTMESSIEYSDIVVELLLKTYKYIDLRNEHIQRWCWTHHRMYKLRPILLFMGEHDCDGTLLKISLETPKSPDAILCFTPKIVKRALRNNIIVAFIQWMLEYHKAYANEPTHHMKGIFKALCIYVYSNLEYKTMDTPLPETGSFETVPRLNLSHKGAYIRIRNLTGFVTDTPPKEAKWCPVDAVTSYTISNYPVEVWTNTSTSGPKTLMECALMLTSEDAWTYKNTIHPFKWYESDTGAFLTVVSHITVLGETMRIRKASWSKEESKMTADNGFEIKKSDLLEIEHISPPWTYLDNNICHMIHIRVKMCHAVSLSPRSVRLDIQYAQDLLQCFGTDVIEEEYEWNIESRTTAMASNIRMVFLGTMDGIIYEYDFHSSLSVVRRTFDGHSRQIQKMLTMAESLVSICEHRMNIWDLCTGENVLHKYSDSVYVDLIKIDGTHFWVLEENELQPIITKWDTVNKIPVAVLQNDFSKGTIHTFDKPEPGVIVGKQIHYIKNDITTNIHIEGDITCVTGSQMVICGGTSIGDIFTIDPIDSSTRSFQLDDVNIRSIEAIDTHAYVAVGTGGGKVYIWDVLKSIVISVLSIDTTPIRALLSTSLFLLASVRRKISVLSIVPRKPCLSAHAIYCAMSWSYAWKQRILKNCAADQTGAEKLSYTTQFHFSSTDTARQMYGRIRRPSISALKIY